MRFKICASCAQAARDSGDADCPALAVNAAKTNATTDKKDSRPSECFMLIEFTVTHCPRIKTEKLRKNPKIRQIGRCLKKNDPLI
jgi:hypothetical protein